ncbi:MAG: hypothetical protein RL032_1098 [Pseudomonadota bacterium]|jgi:hypothetical protein
MTAVKKRWPDGTPRSQGNAFSAHLDGRPSVFGTLVALANAQHSINSTRNVEQQRLTGRDYSTLYGISAKADESVRRYRQQISIDPNPQASADKQAKLRGRSNQARSQ